MLFGCGFVVRLRKVVVLPYCHGDKVAMQRKERFLHFNFGSSLVIMTHLYY